MEQNHWIHQTGFFLPWHRWFVYQFTKSLRDECGYKGVAPYWDWTLDSADVYGSSFFKESSPVSGLGGWGDPNNDFTVPDGALSSGFALSYPVYHHLRRNWTIQPFIALAARAPKIFLQPYVFANSTFTPEKVRNLTNSYVGDFVGFQTDIEYPEHMHSAVHVMMSGDLGGTCPASAPANCIGGPTFSVNDPLFMMHHGMIDKVWADWQAKDSRNAAAFAGGSIQDTTYWAYPTGMAPWLNLSSPIPTDGLFPSTTVGDVLSIHKLCYCYE